MYIRSSFEKWLGRGCGYITGLSRNVLTLLYFYQQQRATKVLVLRNFAAKFNFRVSLKHFPPFSSQTMLIFRLQRPHNIELGTLYWFSSIKYKVEFVSEAHSSSSWHSKLRHSLPTLDSHCADRFFLSIFNEEQCCTLHK